MKLLTQTNVTLLNLSLLLLRCMIGVILFAGGAGKVLGWFGGFGMKMTIQYYSMSGISVPLTYLSAYTEFIGGFLLIIGLLTRPVAFAIMINMLVATILTMPKGFLAGGAAYPFSLTVSAIIILLAGPMAYSVDWLLNKNKTQLVNV
jgi:putative oxidoreductase